MIVILGASGYIGSAFVAELSRRGIPFAAVSRSQVDYTNFDVLMQYLKTVQPEFVINAAGYAGKPNVDACERNKAETLAGNVFLPFKIRLACDTLGIPWAQISSGCIYNGPGPFKETDEPNFCWDHPPCSFYTGSKALAEECVKFSKRAYIWRLRIPFDEQDGPRNYLSKLQRYPRLLEAKNSLSHRGDFVKACLDLWQSNAPFGTYNVTNPGSVTTRQVVLMIHMILQLDREWEFFEDDAEFYRTAAVAPRSNCVLDVSKLLATGVRMRPIELAVEDALRNWRKE